MAPLHPPARRAALAISSVVAGLGLAVSSDRARPRAPPPTSTWEAAAARTPGRAPPRCRSAPSPRRRRSRSRDRPCSSSSGTYTDEVFPWHSGASGSPITFQPAAGAAVDDLGRQARLHDLQPELDHRVGLHDPEQHEQRVLRLQRHRHPAVGQHGADVGQRVSGSTAYGMYLNSMTNSVVTGNLVTDNSASGIYLTNGSTGNQITGNESSLNAYGYVRNAVGIDLRGPGNLVSGNRVHDNEDSGIQSYPGGDRNTIVDNVSYHNKGFTTAALTNCSAAEHGNTAGCITGDHGIDDFGVTGSSVVGNTVYDNVAAGINLEGVAVRHVERLHLREQHRGRQRRVVPRRRRRHGQVPPDPREHPRRRHLAARDEPRLRPRQPQCQRHDDGLGIDVLHVPGGVPGGQRAGVARRCRPTPAGPARRRPTSPSRPARPPIDSANSGAPGQPGARRRWTRPGRRPGHRRHRRRRAQLRRPRRLRVPAPPLEAGRHHEPLDDHLPPLADPARRHPDRGPRPRRSLPRQRRVPGRHPCATRPRHARSALPPTVPPSASSSPPPSPPPRPAPRRPWSPRPLGRAANAARATASDDVRELAQNLADDLAAYRVTLTTPSDTSAQRHTDIGAALRSDLPSH